MFCPPGSFSTRSRPPPYSRRVRASGVAALVAAILVGAGFTVQAVGLPAPPRRDVLAARAAEWILRYRYITSRLSIDGRIVQGRCFHGWFGEPRRRGTLLLLGRRAAVAAIPHRPYVVYGPVGAQPADLLTAAGCTRVLGPHLANAAVAGDIHARHVEFHERLVLALSFGKTSVLVAPRQAYPVGVEVADISSEIHLAPLRASQLRALRRQL